MPESRTPQERTGLGRVFAVGRQFLFSPTAAAATAGDEVNFMPCLWLFIANVVAQTLLSSLQGFEFLDPSSIVPREHQSVLFWCQVSLWQVPIDATLIAFALGLLAWYRAGSGPVRTILSMVWSLLPGFLLINFKLAGSESLAHHDAAQLLAAAQSVATAKRVLGAGFLLCVGLFVPLWRRLERRQVIPVVNLMLGVNAIFLVLFIPLLCAVLWNLSNLYIYLTIAAAIWTLVLLGLALRPLTKTPLRCTFMAMILANVLQVCTALTLGILGIMPKEILKAVLVP